jgi:endo-1,4-beta-xylanase
MATFATTNGISTSAQHSQFGQTVRIFRAVMFVALLPFLFNLTGCSPKSDSLNPENQPDVSYVSSLRAIASSDSNNTLKAVASFLVGAAVNPQLIASNPAYKLAVQQNFNSITTENSIQMNRIHPKAGQYSWTETDALVNFAKQSNMRVHGHILIWHKGLPSWVTNFQGDSLAWENLMKTHIQTVVGHYKGNIKSWNVVNEAFNSDGSVQKSVWYEHLGPDYIARCFQYAHEADPQALLFYNDNNYVSQPKKSAAVYALLKNLKQRNIPIDGVGLQMHISINSSESILASVTRQYASTGLLIHISELDVRMNPDLSLTFVLTESVKNEQALKYKTLVKIYRSIVPNSQQFGITTWNVGDKDSWLVRGSKIEDHPLLFDSNYNRKISYYGFMQGLSE